MGLTYDATARNGRPLPLGRVEAGDFVSIRGIGDPSGRDSQGRCPHLFFKPGGINQSGVLPTHYDVALPPAPAGGSVPQEPEFHDDGGALYVPIAGEISIVGGAGTWDFAVYFRRGRACEEPTEFRWKLTSYTTSAVRLTAIIPPHGAEYIDISETATDMAFNHGTTTSSFALAPAGRYYLQQVTSISWLPARDGQLVIHGRM